MGLLDWLFGRERSGDEAVQQSSQWSLSENGNPTRVIGTTRLTVFQQDRGWKYCNAYVNHRRQSIFSQPYANEQAVKDEAMADFSGEPSQHKALSAVADVDRRQRWEAHINERERIIAELRAYLTSNSDLEISLLRKPEAKIASHINQLGWQMSEYHCADVSDGMIAIAKMQKIVLEKLANDVVTRICAKEALRKPRSTPASASILPSNLAERVDCLIRLIADGPVITVEEQERLNRAFRLAAAAKRMNEGLAFGHASGAPDFLNQDEASFHRFMKQADQDLSWQCDTVTDAFEPFWQSGDIPAPHYPMRITILLRKAKDFDREKAFLIAWCMHFSFSNGVTYDKLVQRAHEIGALP